MNVYNFTAWRNTFALRFRNHVTQRGVGMRDLLNNRPQLCRALLRHVQLTCLSVRVKQKGERRQFVGLHASWRHLHDKALRLLVCEGSGRDEFCDGGVSGMGRIESKIILLLYVSERIESVVKRKGIDRQYTFCCI